jgi:hypothetical protein
MPVKKAKFNGAGASTRFGTVLPHIYWNRVGTEFAISINEGGGK